jgi:hypothetical protein
MLLLLMYLNNRRSKAKTRGHFFECKIIRAGTSQGSPSPFLFNVYIADMPTSPGIEVSKFADDTAAYISDGNVNYKINSFRIICLTLQSGQGNRKSDSKQTRVLQ